MPPTNDLGVRAYMTRHGTTQFPHEPSMKGGRSRGALPSVTLLLRPRNVGQRPRTPGQQMEMRFAALQAAIGAVGGAFFWATNRPVMAGVFVGVAWVSALVMLRMSRGSHGPAAFREARQPLPALVVAGFVAFAGCGASWGVGVVSLAVGAAGETAAVLTNAGYGLTACLALVVAWSGRSGGED